MTLAFNQRHELIQIKVMLSLILSTRSNIVNIDVSSFEVFSLDDVVHNLLEIRYSIGHSKWNLTNLVQRPNSFESCAFSFFRLDSNLDRHWCAKYLITGNLTYHVLNPRRRISIQESGSVYRLGVIHKSLVIFRRYYKCLSSPLGIEKAL